MKQLIKKQKDTCYSRHQQEGYVMVAITKQIFALTLIMEYLQEHTEQYLHIAGHLHGGEAKTRLVQKN